MDKKKIDYCICHKSLESGESVEYTAIDTQTVVNYDGVDAWQETYAINDVEFLCSNCGKQMPEKVKDIVFV